MNGDAVEHFVRREVIARRRNDAHVDPFAAEGGGEVQQKGAGRVARAARIGVGEEQDAHASDGGA